jgi:simple sugar transport system ATP-binding protein
LVGEYLPHQLLRIELAQKMLGRELTEFRERPHTPSDTAETAAYLSARGVSVGRGVIDADVDVAPGEVLGVAGLLGSGRTELARALTGLDRLDAGSVSITAGDERVGNLRDALNAGIVYSSENRRSEGIVGDLTILQNIALALQAQRGVLHRIGPQRERELAESWVEALDIRPPDVDRLARTLSGGNQQKVMLARLLAVSPQVLVLDEPTRGIDVGAKVEIQNIVGDLAENGIAVVFISAELEEVLRMGNRVVVMRDGRIVDTLDAAQVTVDSILALVARPDESTE